jgi:predicted acylesterase/phospholipase RssA
MKKPTYLAISGGSMDGFCIGAGMLYALEEAGLLRGPLVCAGTSAGSALACWVAAGRPIGGLLDILGKLRDSDLRDPRPLWRARMGWIDNIWQGRKLRVLLRRIMPERAELRHPWGAYAVPVTGSLARDVAHLGAPADCCAASMAIPVIFPPVQLSDGQYYTDGGTSMNLPLPLDPQQYSRVICLVLSGKHKTYRPPASVLSGAMTQFGRLLAGQTDAAELRARAWPNALVLRPDLDGAHGSLRLDKTLIDPAIQYARLYVETHK